MIVHVLLILKPEGKLAEQFEIVPVTEGVWDVILSPWNNVNGDPE